MGKKLERNGGNTKSVNSVTSDMSASYLSAVREVFPNAKQYKKTGRAFRIVKSLDDFYASTSMVEAQARLDKLCSWMRRCRLKPMKDAALTLRNHGKEIVNYFHTRLTNAICEGINAMIQAAKRKARGFHTFEGYAAMIYLVAGKLELATPVLF